MAKEKEKTAQEKLDKINFVQELKVVFSMKWVETVVKYFLVAVAIAIVGLIITNYVISFIHLP